MPTSTAQANPFTSQMMQCQMSCNSGIQVKETHVVGRLVGICTIVIWDDNADIGHKLFDAHAHLIESDSEQHSDLVFTSTVL